MFRRRFSNLILPEDRGPLRVMFVLTEMVVGGAETLLAEILRKMDRDRFRPELCCLKRLAELGEVLAEEVPTFTELLGSKYDVGVLRRLTDLLRQRRIDAVVTVGTGGDRMFWGRLAAWRAEVPVILSALHSTGDPVRVERMNRMLAPITDGFIGCAKSHSEFLVEGEKCPRDKVFTVWNGVDVNRFRPRDKATMRANLEIERDVPVAGIVAALRPEKQHVMLIEAMGKVVDKLPDAKLVVVGDGVERGAIEAKVSELGLSKNVRLLGTRHDVPEVLAAMDLKVLSSRMEANPASSLEASACGLPVVVPNVGSLPDTVLDGETGVLCRPNNSTALADAMVQVLSDPQKAREMGAAGRDLVCRRFSVKAMVRGYERLIEGVYGAASQGSHLTPEQFDCTMEREMERIAAEQVKSTRVASCD
jgi:glycosyltransferase involved in cell wall biosynthesis